jgi:hypothetical protein
VDRPQGSARRLLRQLVSDVGRVPERVGEAGEIRDHEHVAGAACGQCLSKAGPNSSLPRQTVVDVHVVIVDAECLQNNMLFWEVETPAYPVNS